MDYSNRNAQPHTGTPGAATVSQTRRNRNNDKWTRIGVVAAVVVVVALIIGAILVTSGSNTPNEARYVDTNKLQAVFLNTGQVYFGNVKTLNDKYIVLTNIYYLQTANSSGSASTSSSTSNNVSLVKLGCELHQPYDQMIINRSQVTFWENLQDTGQVAKAVKTFEQQNPNGQKCADQSSSASTTSGSSTQNAGGATTPSATTPAKP